MPNIIETPQRIQRKRTKGWRAPPDTVYVGRPTKWGNQFKVSDFGHQRAYDLFKHHQCSYLIQSELCVNDYLYPSDKEFDWSKSWSWTPDFKRTIKAELGGKTLMCFCPVWYPNGERVPCHADILLEIANPGLVIPSRIGL